MDEQQIKGTGDGLATLEIPVYGMDCPSCAGSLELALGRVPGVKTVNADVEGCRATISGDVGVLSREVLAATVEELGFALEPPAPEGMGALQRNWWKLAAFGAAAAGVIAGGLYAYAWVDDYLFKGGGLGEMTIYFGSLSIGAIALAFAVGLVVAFSPFTFAMAPAVMGYVASSGETSFRGHLRLSSGFVSGIVTADVMLGALYGAIGTAAIAFFAENLRVSYPLVAAILLGLALVVLRIWKIDIPMFKPRLQKARSARGAFLMGVPFGLIACPACTPLLLPVALGAAATGNALYGAGLMGAFALGRGIPMVVLGTSTGAFQRMKGFTSYVPWIERAVGVLLLVGAVFFLREWLVHYLGVTWLPHE
ncbi:MAG: sulfite exporter TauE/SafE family protein [Chloroflexi bacterium]|nr:sulfite exporter TauE/SafE family protein [Chloroflexota bacterium]